MTALQQLDWQRALFSTRLNRFDLLKIKVPPADFGKRVRVSRNHGFEQVASALPPFLAFGAVPARIEIGDYDDSLSLPPGDADVELLWLDFARYDRLASSDLASWLVERLDALRASSRAPIIIANATGTGDRDRCINDALDGWSRATPAGFVLDLAAIAAGLGDDAFDARRAPLTGTSLSDATCLEAARVLGLQVLPGLLLPNIKAVALDLDNTLYGGVLGEDGPDGLLLTKGHGRLQELLVVLAESGVLLTVISRNEREDVDALFRLRSDFPLKASHVANWQVSWGDKAAAIRRAAADLRIGVDAFLFLDDNLGELTAVGSELPGVKLIFAGFEPDATVEALKRYPALWPTTVSETDVLRAADLTANAERDALAVRLDRADYLRALDATLTFSADPREDRERLREISTKTNQFNLALARLTDLHVHEYLAAEDRRVIHVRLADRLADSGSVAALFVRRDGNRALVEELCISCRAMGRGLEDILVTEALRHANEALATTRVGFVFAAGPRNEPARRWLRDYAGVEPAGEAGVLEVSWSAERAEHLLAASPVRIRWSEA